ncbi:hypothetical protein K491DRAFT_707826 [Lophiostoma macrostomum CBS 122681]|uniref:Zn(2)-C6 fungal-type domain-containing protein n=1 Tax=Lophiostoma macrostomum CBS 122681 TaxID=1314788 RepID=A0A6A6STR6_9PLEO|nr:hypothetical protein K491DRAFT_707826 [Lophiostoma macrostomum CBS 122681]
METAEQTPTDRAVLARTTQACQRCRSLKTRCLPSEQASICRRCLSSKRECVWAEAPRRPKRARGPSRISQVEQKIDGLFATLVSSEGSKKSDQEAAQTTTVTDHTPYIPPILDRPQDTIHPGSWLPKPTSFELQPAPPDRDADPSQRYVEKLHIIHSFGEETDLSRPPSNVFNAPSKTEPALNSPMLEELLASGEAESMLHEYRNMTGSFPFVPVAAGFTAQLLSIQKPMLFLAIITIASWKDHQRQMKLDEYFRTELANRTIIRPRRTLSLVQSLIVYLGWYHFVFSHKTQQIYSLIQLTIGLALDLGLHEKNKRSIGMPGIPKAAPFSSEVQRERQRSFLGCYYLSSAIAVGLMKPNMLKYDDYMVYCGSRLQQDREYPSDKAIGRLISLRRLEDQINSTFNTEEATNLPISDSRIAMNLRFMETQLEEWRRDSTSETMSRTLELANSFAEMSLHAIALRPSPTNSTSQSSTTTQLTALLVTLEAGKRFFDVLLDLPVSDYHLVSFDGWMHLPHAVITVARLCIPDASQLPAQWDVKAAQDRVRLDLYLESLCYRMQGLSTFDKVKQPHPDFWCAMKLIMDLTRAWYCRKIRGNTTSSSQPTSGGIPTPDTLRNYDGRGTENHAASHGPSFDQNAQDPFNTMDDVNQVMNSHDPFSFMRNEDFDMDQFLDMGIWGSEGYEGMGFGGGGMQS